MKVSVDMGLKQLKVISRGKDGGWEWVPVSGGHRDKRVGESAGSVFIQFDSEGVLSVRKPRVSRKDGFREIIYISKIYCNPYNPSWSPNNFDHYYSILITFYSKFILTSSSWDRLPKALEHVVPILNVLSSKYCFKWTRMPLSKTIWHANISLFILLSYHNPWNISRFSTRALWFSTYSNSFSKLSFL